MKSNLQISGFGLALIGILLLPCVRANAQWVQTGGDIHGDAGEELGTSVSLSSDGEVLAVGAPFNDSMGMSAGCAKVFEWQDSLWMQRGETIYADTTGDREGHSVDLSADGTLLAIGAPGNDGNGANTGRVRVFKWDGNSWNQQGQDLQGTLGPDGSELGTSVCITPDGKTIAAGGPEFSVFDAGHVRAYTWNGSQWVMKGGDFYGEFGAKLGASVSLSSSGNILAIGAPWYNGIESAGSVRIYEWNGAAWNLRGDQINGDADGDRFGSSIGLSSDGNRLAVGDPAADSLRGQVRVYSWNGSAWVQLGADISGAAAFDGLGYSVSLSSDGQRLVIGSPFNAGDGVRRGLVGIYDWSSGDWIKQQDILGEHDYDGLGISVCISADGSRLAVGAPWNSDSGLDAGQVRVFEFQQPSIVADEWQDCCNAYPNPTTGRFSIDLGVQVAQAEVTITDLLGRLVGTSQHHRTSELQMTIEGKPGVYFLRLTSGDKTATLQIVKL